MLKKFLPEKLAHQYTVAGSLLAISAIALWGSVSDLPLASVDRGLASVSSSITRPLASEFAPREIYESGNITLSVPRSGILKEELLVIVNSDSPVSVASGEHYIKERGIPEKNLVKIPMDKYGHMVIWAGLDEMVNIIDAHIKANNIKGVKAFAYVWTIPDRAYSGSVSPLPRAIEVITGIPGMLLTVGYTYNPPVSETLADMKKFIDKSSQADSTRPGAEFPTGTIYLYNSSDRLRSLVRDPVNSFSNGFNSQYALLMKGDAIAKNNATSSRKDWKSIPDAGWDQVGTGLAIDYRSADDMSKSEWLSGVDDIMFYFTGATGIKLGPWNSADPFVSPTFLPGAIGDHVTSFAGEIGANPIQGPATTWLRGGASASSGFMNTSGGDPGTNQNVFTNVSVLVPEYFKGLTALEAINRSITTRGSSLLVGDPLARPFGTIINSSTNEKFEFETTIMRNFKRLDNANVFIEPGETYEIRASDSEITEENKNDAVVVSPDNYASSTRFALAYPRKMKFTFTDKTGPDRNLYNYYWFSTTTKDRPVIDSAIHGSTITNGSTAGTPAGSTIIWNPFVAWPDGAPVCDYSYDGGLSWKSAKLKTWFGTEYCPNDIPPPEVPGDVTLMVRGNNGTIDSARFTYDPVTALNSPPNLVKFDSTSEARIQYIHTPYNIGDRINITAHFDKPIRDGSYIDVMVNDNGPFSRIVKLTKNSSTTLSGTYVVPVNSLSNLPLGLNIQEIKDQQVIGEDDKVSGELFPPAGNNLYDNKILFVDTRDKNLSISSPDSITIVTSWNNNTIVADWGNSQSCKYMYTCGALVPCPDPERRLNKQFDVACTEAGLDSIPPPPPSGFVGDTRANLTLLGTQSNGQITVVNTSFDYIPTSAPDTSKPEVRNFNLEQISGTLNARITVTATDDREVTGYLIKDNNTAPLVNDSNWQSVVPTTFTFTSEGNKTLYLFAKDAAGNISDPVVGSVTIVIRQTQDTTAPIVTNTTQSSQPAQTTSFSLTVRTDENATCAYSQNQNDQYNTMTRMRRTGGRTTHSHVVYGAVAGNNAYYVRCSDTDGNTSNATAINVNVTAGSSDTVPPAINDMSPSGEVSIARLMQFSTSERAECRYSTSNTTFANMTPLDQTGNVVHSTPLSGLSNKTHTFFLKCRDQAGNINEDSIPLSFNLVAPLPKLSVVGFTANRAPQEGGSYNLFRIGSFDWTPFGDRGTFKGYLLNKALNEEVAKNVAIAYANQDYSNESRRVYQDTSLNFRTAGEFSGSILITPELINQYLTASGKTYDEIKNQFYIKVEVFDSTGKKVAEGESSTFPINRASAQSETPVSTKESWGASLWNAVKSLWK